MQRATACFQCALRARCPAIPVEGLSIHHALLLFIPQAIVSNPTLRIAARHATSVLDVRAVKLPVDTGAVGSPLREKRTVCSVKFTLLELELWAL